MSAETLTRPVSRRLFLRQTSAAGVLAASAATGIPLLSACGSGAEEGGDERLDIKLAWIPNVEYAGFFVAADHGLYTESGVEPNFLPGGPNSSVIPLISSNQALIGIEAIPENVANAIGSGSNLKIVGAMFQRSPECWVSLASDPILEPTDIEGKRLGITLAGKNTALVFMRENGVDPAKVELVPIQFDPAPLVAGEIDALWGLASNQPVSLQLRGHETAVMPLADFGFNRMQNVLFVTEETLADEAKSGTVRSFLKASQEGWQAALRDPAGAARITVEEYGADLGLDVDEQTMSLEAVRPFIERDAGDDHPQFWMSDELIQETITSLDFIGVRADESMFSNEVLG
ncbi:ABC transporter substrate-binding protein [Phytoactinopolyspora limicola]|uniref:ABC transporter substrate-binding protein n=1 Tax=Phytoactinopolyspora limicola TaxID=2715536 RepID=UPI00140C3E04|nr:ABC transporter substrate-binding protein [Phytoactinopolyspora limicola]